MEDQKLQREIRNQRCLNHRNVVKVYDVVDRDGAIHIIMEYCPKELFDYIVAQKRMKEEEARRIFRQLVAAVEHCHEQGVVHRDLKPENILLDADYNVKLADFGLSSEWHDGGYLTESCGSPNYAAPELLSKNCRYVGPEVDVWSCGVVLFTLLCNKLPFDADSCPELFKLIKRGQYSTPAYVSQEAKDLIAQMLQVDASKRVTLAEVKKHPWFVSAGNPDEFVVEKRCIEEKLPAVRPGSAEPKRADSWQAGRTASPRLQMPRRQSGRPFARWRWQRSSRPNRLFSAEDAHKLIQVA